MIASYKHFQRILSKLETQCNDATNEHIFLIFIIFIFCSRPRNQLKCISRNKKIKKQNLIDYFSIDGYSSPVKLDLNGND